MKTIIKIAEFKAADTKSLDKIISVFENANEDFVIVRDKEYTQYAYVCVKDSIE